MTVQRPEFVREHEVGDLLSLARAGHAALTEADPGIDAGIPRLGDDAYRHFELVEPVLAEAERVAAVRRGIVQVGGRAPSRQARAEPLRRLSGDAGGSPE